MQMFQYQPRGEDAQGKRLRPRWRWKSFILMVAAVIGCLGYWWLHGGQTLLLTWLNHLSTDFFVGGITYGFLSIAFVLLYDIFGFGEIKNKMLRRIVVTICVIGCVWFMALVLVLVIYSLWFYKK